MKQCQHGREEDIDNDDDGDGCHPAYENSHKREGDEAVFQHVAAVGYAPVFELQGKHRYLGDKEPRAE